MMFVAMVAEAVTPLQPTYPANNSQPPAPPGQNYNNEPRDRGIVMYFVTRVRPGRLHYGSCFFSRPSVSHGLLSRS